MGKRRLLQGLFFVLSLVAFPLWAQAPVLGSRAAALIDVTTGTVLYSKNGDEEIPPASLTKLMTMHLVLEDAAAGKVSLDDIVSLPPPSWARNQPPRSSLMFLDEGQTVSLREILLGLAIPSGNDAAVAAALYIEPSVEAFVRRMNQEAQRLGLSKTVFVEPSGISEYNMTTALEFARFCRFYLTRHPEAPGAYHSVRQFAYPKSDNVSASLKSRPGTIVQPNRNELLSLFPGVDGLKTGYIDEAGYNIALSAEREGTRFAAVLLGAPSAGQGERIRTNDSLALLAWAFDAFKTLRPRLPELAPIDVFKAKEKTALLVPGAAPEHTVPKNRGAKLRFETVINEPITAPLPAGSVVGEFILFDDEGELYRVPLALKNALEQGNWFRRFWDSIRLFFMGLGKQQG
jgi:D-alanyl-D-alanine carboxypeptidase (penicillin-binding protein 5/6)